jgi:glucosamine--fructose-6-phosphate aminotransferase (isomerizing)
MCGIVGAISQRDVIPVLLEGLKRLEYRGYDSAGIAVIQNKKLERLRRLGKVKGLENALINSPLVGEIGIAHTRWATHGSPSESNAHPHVSGNEIAVVHNGIIENHAELRSKLEASGFEFSSETDSEVIAHLVSFHFSSTSDMQKAVTQTLLELDGGYASIVVMHVLEPKVLYIARSGTPVVIGLGKGENFVASDVAALLPETNRFQFLEEGDLAVLRQDSVKIYDPQGAEVERPIRESEHTADSADRGSYKHYMAKEIHEQPAALINTLADRISNGSISDAIFGENAKAILSKVASIHIVACGTSYHAGLVARSQLEELARLPCTVDIASEYRYRNPVVLDNTLFVSISQSGETADTLAALRSAKKLGYLSTLAICNVPESSLTRESDLVLMTQAGQEIGVASTKAFTTQLAALLMLTIVVAKHQGLGLDKEHELVTQLAEIPGLIEQSLLLDDAIAELSKDFADKRHALFLGRGALNPIAMEGALKLKEISYIHAEAYAAGELKHGPLALVDDNMPVVAIAPNNELLEKLKSNLAEVRARGGKLYVFADPDVDLGDEKGIQILRMPAHVNPIQEPLLYTVPLQLLAYHAAVLKGTDIDQPRNLAKSVTVE